DDRRVEADHVVAALHERLPPLALDVLLERDAEGAVVPRRAGASVDLARLEHEATALREADDGVETVLDHGCSLRDAAARASWIAARHVNLDSTERGGGCRPRSSGAVQGVAMPRW